jgi:hypothetical protein
MDIQLPDFVLADLYKNTLVITSDAGEKPNTLLAQATQKVPEKVPETVQTVQKKWYLGENKRGIVIIVKDENAVFINDEWLETLTKLLDALKINLADTAIVNTVHTQVGFAQLQTELKARHIFLFGVTTEQIQLPFAIPDYQVQNYAGCTILRSPVLTLVAPAKTTDGIKAEKRKLWESLKRIAFS